MATSATAPGGAPRSRIFRSARLIVLLLLLIALGVCLALSWATRGAMANLAFLRAQKGAARQSLVDLTPWQTAQTLSSLAVTSEEQEYAREAEHLADHEVNQAFAAALRMADLENRHRVLTGPALALSRKVALLQHQIAQDQQQVDQLKAKAPPPPARAATPPAPASHPLQVAQAQLTLDTDELADAQRDLARATGNLSFRLQNELASHEETIRKIESAQQAGALSAVASVQTHRTLSARIAAWFSQRSRYASIEQAVSRTQSDTSQLTAQHNALETKVDAANGSSDPLAALQDRTTERQILSTDDDRIQTDQQLASLYAKWGDQVLLQHRIVLHLILQSLEWILAIVLAMILADALVRRLMAHPSLDRRQTQTLRTILEVGVQVAGVLLIVLVLFGPPQQTATMIGLATAALTIALQDYILAFLGWFMLVGKNGIRVGDMVEINGVAGEVVDLGLMSTTLLETTGLAEQGEPTGRRVSFLNSYAIRGTSFNFSSEGQWLWDEITVSVPAGADIYGIATSIENAAREETAESARLAEQEWKRSAHPTGLTRLTADPIVTLRPSVPVVDIAAGIDIQLRYVTRAAGRFEVRDRLYRHVIQLLQEASHHIPVRPAALTESGVRSS
ncbi:MAG TPA: mechanosensitive ion channel family protein [Acidobacteriaceae bacterium]|jgi:small-conductance mechanosensitive channel|nr:mechanosensitive ion channel family protein [Acidobacteriaceae bacterium]